MNNRIAISRLILCSYAYIGSAYGDLPDSDGFGYYANANLRSWHYAQTLLKTCPESDRMRYEVDLSSSAFTYWILVSRGSLPKDKSFEIVLKDVLITKKMVRQELLDNPLARGTRTQRGLGISKVVMSDGEYGTKSKEFHEFLKKIE